MAAIRLTGPVPGPRSVALMARRKAAVLGGVATLHPIFVAGASGATITDVDGNTFLDFTGGIGVMNAGHADPSVTAAITEQAQRFTHTCFQVMGYEPYVALAEHLARITPGRYEKRALLLSTGAEAIENAVKIARGYTKRGAVLCFEHGFHGRTLLGLTLTGKAAPYKSGFGPFAPEVAWAPSAMAKIALEIWPVVGSVSGRGKDTGFEPSDRMLASEEVVAHLRRLNDRTVGTRDLHAKGVGGCLTDSVQLQAIQ